jgi:starch phosphorylase
MPAAERAGRLAADEMARAKSLAAWEDQVRQNWSGIKVVDADVEPGEDLTVRDEISATAWVHLGRLSPDDITVQFYFGEVDVQGEILAADTARMEHVGSDGEKGHLFRAEGIPCPRSGRFGFTIRVLPSQSDLVTPYLPGLVTWANPDLGNG